MFPLFRTPEQQNTTFQRMSPAVHFLVPTNWRLCWGSNPESLVSSEYRNTLRLIICKHECVCKRFIMRHNVSAPSGAKLATLNGNVLPFISKAIDGKSRVFKTTNFHNYMYLSPSCLFLLVCALRSMGSYSRPHL